MSASSGLTSDNRWIRLETLGEIVTMGDAAAPLIPAVERLQSDPARDVRDRAERTLAVIRKARGPR